MTNYIPFLKTKINEFSAIKNLDDDIAKNLTPFFDINRKADKNETANASAGQISISQKYSESEYKDKIAKLIRKFAINLTDVHLFYLDDSEIDNDLFVDGKQSYEFVINQFSQFLFIPVIGIDRSPDRNNAVFLNKNIIQLDIVAIRLVYDDIQVGLTDIKQLVMEANKYFNNIELIIDMKVIPQDADLSVMFSIITRFVQKIHTFSKIIITGSSIPKSIGELVSTKEKKDIPRKELELYALLNRAYPNLCYGDYTIVSPFYSDVDMPPEMLLNITAAKVIYSYGKCHHIHRGQSLQGGNFAQYKDLCTSLAKETFFRGKSYSYGDNFIGNAKSRVKNITQNTILNPTINAHISYMYKDYHL